MHQYASLEGIQSIGNNLENAFVYSLNNSLL